MTTMLTKATINSTTAMAASNSVFTKIATFIASVFQGFDFMQD